MTGSYLTSSAREVPDRELEDEWSMINRLDCRYDELSNAVHFQWQKYDCVGEKTIFLGCIRVDVLQMLCTLIWEA